MTSFPIEKPNLEESLLDTELLRQKQKKKIREEIGDGLLEGEKEILEVDEKHFIRRDPWASAVISLYLNNELRTEIEEQHVEEFFEHYDKKGHSIKYSIYRKIIPVQHKDYKWEEFPSRMMRKKLRTKADEVISLASQLNGLTVKNFSLDAKYIYDKDMISDDFGDVAGFSSKKAKKRKDEKSGISLLFNRTFIKNKQENIIFFNSSHDEKHKEEWKSSTYLLEKIHKIIQEYRGSALFSSIAREFILNENTAIAQNFSQMSSIFIGIKKGNEIEYISWGKINVYLYDGEEFKLVEAANDSYLGGYVQLIKSKHGNRVIDLLYPEMIKTNKIKINGEIGLLIATENLDSVIRGKRKIRFRDAKELIEKLMKKSEKVKRENDAGALFFYF